MVMNKIKLNTMEASKLSSREMQVITGGRLRVCGCACANEGNGGSSTADNRDANVWVGDFGGTSPGPIKEIRRVETLE